eukprot:gnl/TRDRNA2_/TRDRNA2_174769_c2_seq10.p1 gnl/TRDRNA2_/TRDRNA2_174769_c2~~gnl/TRDRNA2_/TRDRNA2_174769_c2_seq10.p1  ORF type:complete len:244 (-),score=23.34 gnl/TRDRNA2_/TRDRNA2_174769_c2_seq10:813-1544(-)
MRRLDSLDSLRLEPSIPPLAGSPPRREEAVFDGNALANWSWTVRASQEQRGTAQEGEDEQLGAWEDQHSPVPGSYSHQKMSGSSGSPRGAIHSGLSPCRLLNREQRPSTAPVLPPGWVVDVMPSTVASQGPGSSDYRHVDLDDASSRLGRECIRSRPTSIPTPEICAICMMEMSSGEVLNVWDVCGHTFHSSCFVRWACESKFCPLCRQEVYWSRKSLSPEDFWSLQALRLSAVDAAASSVAD